MNNLLTICVLTIMLTSCTQKPSEAHEYSGKVSLAASSVSPKAVEVIPHDGEKIEIKGNKTLIHLVFTQNTQNIQAVNANNQVLTNTVSNIQVVGGNNIVMSSHNHNNVNSVQVDENKSGNTIVVNNKKITTTGKVESVVQNNGVADIVISGDKHPVITDN